MENRWQLSEELKVKYLPVVQEFIDRVEAGEGEEELKINLSDTGLNPYTLKEMLKDLGYEEGEMDKNGWQMDFWIPFTKNGFKKICIEGTGITFQLGLIERS